MRQGPQISVGGKGATAPMGTQAEEKSLEAIARQMENLTARLDKAKDDILFQSDIRSYTIVVLEQAQLNHPLDNTVIRQSKRVKIVFEHGFYLLKKDDPNFKLLHARIFGNEETGQAPDPHLGFRYWRVDEKAKKLREDAVRSSVDLLISTGDKDTARKVVEALEPFINPGGTSKVEIVPAVTKETAAQKRAREQAEIEAEIAAADAAKTKAA